MTDFTITPPAAPAGTPASLANYNGSYIAEVNDALSTVLNETADLRETNFDAGDSLPFLTYANATTPWGPVITVAPDENAEGKQINWTTLRGKIDQLAALIAPDAPDLAEVTADVPVLDVTAPTLPTVTVPSSDIGDAPTNAPTLDEATTPDAPVIELPSVPSFEDLSLPSPPSFVIATFDDAAPQFLLAPLSAEFSYVDSGYVSSLQDPLVAKLLNDLTEGTYGIEANVEEALWGRARDRAAQAAREEIDSVLRASSGMSFPMPTGALQSALAKAQQKYQATLSEANRAISEKRADLYFEGRKFTIQQVQEYERTAIALYNAVQERAMSAARAVFDTAVAQFNANLAHFNAQQSAYKVGAEVFETRIRAELLKAEVFKAQIDAERLRVDFNRAKIDQYKAQLDGINTVVTLYRSQLQAATLHMQLQQQKLDLFRTNVSAYAERVRAKEAEFGMYKAQLAGNQSLVDVYRAQIDAHNAKLSGVRLGSQISLDSNQALLQQYQAERDRYIALTENMAKQIDSLLGENRGKIEIYRGYVAASQASAQSFSAANRDYVAMLDQNLRGHMAAVESGAKKAMFDLEKIKTTADFTRTVNADIAKHLGALAATLASGLSSLGVVTTDQPPA